MPIGEADLGVLSELELIQQETIDALVDSLKGVERFKSGAFAQSIRILLPRGGNSISFELYMDDYWKFIDEGVDGYNQSRGSKFKYKKGGKRIPLDAMLSFIANNGLQPAMSITRHKREAAIQGKDKISKHLKKGVVKKNKQDALKSFAFAIGANLKKKGLKPTHFYSNVINDEWKSDFKQRVVIALKEDVEIIFKDIIETR